MKLLYTKSGIFVERKEIEYYVCSCTYNEGEKKHQEVVTKRFMNQNLMSKSEGYVKSILMVDQKHKEYDLFR
jgi:hypothetical protein